jgi:hypothetical protein
MTTPIAATVVHTVNTTTANAMEITAINRIIARPIGR